ncbi:hypothetical protein M427DRAFT_61944 [Gonapodya prolifera JEL478]|uniref:Uncharacterized protein n=1 Tax=Gonapodya prolifera (strain JEL478) TaxID=1344416 RepID=A0A139A1B4_GONPJ|nr:hypothetical protein M427DRAFT_61944 [Gonapodya prolifera JEL478]|eukprot:KXS10580.1 hypothetical protein M427DRAFT_61944 [Gonapodya prolifera JEL478]
MARGTLWRMMALAALLSLASITLASPIDRTALSRRKVSFPSRSLHPRYVTCRQFKEKKSHTTLCGDITYWTTAKNVTDADNQLLTAIADLVGDNTWPETDRDCYAAVQKLFCMYYYRKCNQESKKLQQVCPSVRTNATNYCNRPGIDLNFDDVDKALGGSSMYWNANCWNGQDIQNDDDLVPVLPGSTLQAEHDLDEDLYFEEMLDEAEEAISEQIGELEDEYNSIEGQLTEVGDDIENKVEDLLGGGMGGGMTPAPSSSPSPTPAPAPAPAPAPSSIPPLSPVPAPETITDPAMDDTDNEPPEKCTVLDFAPKLASGTCPQEITYNLIPGHTCIDEDNIQFRTDVQECPCELETQMTLMTPCHSGSQTKISFYDPVGPVGSTMGEIGVPAMKECDRRYNLIPLQQESDQCTMKGAEMNGTGGWAYVSFLGGALLSLASQQTAVTTTMTNWDSVFSSKFTKFDGSVVTSGDMNLWMPEDGKLKVEGNDPGGVATLDITIRTPAETPGMDDPMVLFAFEALADLPLAGLRLYVNNLQRMPVVNNLDQTVAYAVTLPKGADSLVRWEFTWASETGMRKRQPIGGYQYAALSLLAVRGASILDRNGKVPAGLEAPAMPVTTASTSGVGVVSTPDSASSRNGAPDTAYLIVGVVGLTVVLGAAVLMVRRAGRRPEYQQLANPDAENEINEYLAEDGANEALGEPDNLELRRLDYFANEEQNDEIEVGETGRFLNGGSAAH